MPGLVRLGQARAGLARPGHAWPCHSMLCHFMFGAVLARPEWDMAPSLLRMQFDGDAGSFTDCICLGELRLLHSESIYHRQLAGLQRGRPAGLHGDGQRGSATGLEVIPVKD